MNRQSLQLLRIVYGDHNIPIGNNFQITLIGGPSNPVISWRQSYVVGAAREDLLVSQEPPLLSLRWRIQGRPRPSLSTFPHLRGTTLAVEGTWFPSSNWKLERRFPREGSRELGPLLVVRCP